MLQTRAAAILFRQKRGKSGQHRATHHLTGGVFRKKNTESATENNRRHLQVRVKMCGKSAQYVLVTVHVGKPCVMKCPIGRRLRAARPMPAGRQIECCSNATSR